MLNETIKGNCHYKIVKILAKRQSKATYVARNIDTSELVVIKLLEFDNNFAWEELKLFQRQAEILKNLSHPAIPAYHDYFEVERRNFQGFALVQKYLSAKSLKQHIEAGVRFSELEIKAIAANLLEISIYLHEQKPPVIHRDIKPSNILLDRCRNSSERVYLVDFGSVKNIAAIEGSSMTIVGTYGYMPPEQFGGEATPASDIYSLGATLVYLLTGRHPAELPQKNLRIQFEEFTQLTLGFQQWLIKAIDPDPKQRFNSAEAALKALQDCDRISVASPAFQNLPGSKIKLLQSDRALQILFPFHKHNNVLKSLLQLLCVVIKPFVQLVYVVFNEFSGSKWERFYVYCCFASPFLICSLIMLNPFLLLLSIVLMGVYIILLCRAVNYIQKALKSNWNSTLFDANRRVKLQIDHLHISWTYQFFGFKYEQRQPMKKQDIQKLFITTTYRDKNNSIFRRKKRWIDNKVSSSVVIATVSKNHRISNLTSPEADWVGEALSHWWNVPWEQRSSSVTSRK